LRPVALSESAVETPRTFWVPATSPNTVSVSTSGTPCAGASVVAEKTRTACSRFKPVSASTSTRNCARYRYSPAGARNPWGNARSRQPLTGRRLERHEQKSPPVIGWASNFLSLPSGRDRAFTRPRSSAATPAGRESSQCTGHRSADWSAADPGWY